MLRIQFDDIAIAAEAGRSNVFATGFEEIAENDAKARAHGCNNRQ
jgi:hypothetical protein